MKEAILSHLSRDYPWKAELHWFDSIGSTNDHLKALARQGAPHGTAVIAGHQTGGKGRMGRTFESPEGKGVYLSLLLRPSAAPEQLMHLTCAAAVAMCDALEAACGIRPGIKWTNDLVWGKRKLGGILTELGLGAGGAVDYAIIGIGINCSQKDEDFSAEVRSIATSLASVTNLSIDPSAVAAAMLDALVRMDRILLPEKEAILRRYRGSCITLGQAVSVVRGTQVRHGTALEVDDSGALVVAFSDGSTEAVNSGEVSVRGMYGYI